MSPGPAKGAPATDVTGDVTRPMRSDARRNRERIVAAAGAIFATGAADIPLEEIARRAGVGIGTFYRNFETRDQLLEAVYRQRVDALCDNAPRLLAEREPLDALRAFLRLLIDYSADNRDIAPALRAIMSTDSSAFDQGRVRMMGAIASLLAAATEHAAIRRDVGAEDILRIMGGICADPGRTGWQEQSFRLVDLIIDGLRYPARAS